MDLAREWTAFAGCLFVLMGTSLGAAARRNAEDALSWQRQWRDAVGAPEPKGGDPRRGLIIAYRMGGLFFAGIGLGLLYSAAAGRAPLVPGGGRPALAGGLFFTACGLVLAFNAWLRAGCRAPRFLEGELQDFEAPPPFGERVAAFCSRAMIALFLAFGVRLLREGLR